MKLVFSISILLLTTIAGQCQRQIIDSLKNVLATETIEEDTGRLKTLLELSYYYCFNTPDSAIIIASETVKLGDKIGDIKGVAKAYTNIGYSYMRLGQLDLSIESYLEALSRFEKLGIPEEIVNIKYGISEIYESLGDIEKSNEYALDAYNISKNEGIIFFEITGLLRLINLTKEADPDSTISTLKKAVLDLDESDDFRINLMKQNIYQAIAEIYTTTKDYKLAIQNYKYSLEYCEKGNDQYISKLFNSMAMAYFEVQDYKSAIQLADSATFLAFKMGDKSILANGYRILSNTYEHIHKPSKALKYLKKALLYEDSVNNLATKNTILTKEFKYKYEKQAMADSIKNAESQKVKDSKIAAQSAQNDKQKQQTYFLYGGLALALLFGGGIFNRFRVTSKQKGIIEEQKEKVDEAFFELEEKNQEILDSINYAKRIQNAILPPAKVVKEYLQKSFILYKPKDIVAGDFYWLEHRDNKVLFAAADCTGHGVPGAMVSVVCNNGLNRSVREHGLTDPGKILDKTREIIIQEFEKSEDEVKDGMDIALCALEGNKLQYAGAHNPLWIIRNGEVLETKANKQPIGKFDKQQPYTTHTFELEKGDSIYIFSDGYVDQFGGEKGKKFKSKAFRGLLLSIQEKTMEEQRVLIDDAFETWRGNLEQIDDVCVIGVRI